MPLDPASLQSDLESLFANPPASGADCAQAWADAVESYATAIVPASTTVASGIPTLASALAAAFSSPSAASGFDAAFTAFATTVAAGMLPAFTGVPPAAPLNVAAQLAVPQETHAAAAAAFAALIDGWFRTGQAVLVAPPNTVVPWS